MRPPDAREFSTLAKAEENLPVLLCAVCSPFWWHHLNDLFSRLGSPLPGTLEGLPRFGLMQAMAGAQEVDLVDAMHLEKSQFDAPIRRCAAAVLFLQGNRLPAAEDFLLRICVVASEKHRPPAVLIMAGLSSEDDLQSLRSTCARLGVQATVSSVSALDDQLTLGRLSAFLRTALTPSPEVTPRPDEILVAAAVQSDERHYNMANINESLNELMKVDGATASLLADATSGMMLGKAGAGINHEIAAAGNTEVVRAKLKTMKALSLNDSIEDILISLGTQYHIIRPMASKPGIFLYLVLDRAKSNLAMARLKVLEVEKQLTF